MKEEIKKYMAFFTDCPNCGREANREGVAEILEQTYKQGYGQGVIDGEKRQKEIIDKVNDVFKQ